MSFGGASATSLLKQGFAALVGLVIARQLPQWALGARNTGWLGYLGNALATLVASFGAGKLLGREWANAVAIGGALYTVNRAIQDNFTPVGKVLSLSGIGDAGALGDIQPGYFPLPVPTNAMGQPIIPNEIRPMLPPPAAAANGGGMSGINTGTRYTSRF